MYKVIKYFTDLQDNSYAYNVGDVFPREGVTVTDARLKQLSTSANRQGVPLIEVAHDESLFPTAPPAPSAEEAGRAPLDEGSVKKTRGRKSNK